MSERTDDDLMLLYRDGDARAFRKLFERHRGLVYNFARLMLSDADAAEDVLQETFLAVSRVAERYEPRQRFRTWLMRIVRNRCLNHLEHERVRRTAFAEATVVVSRSGGHSPAEQAEVAEQMRLVSGEIARLPEQQREAIALYAFDAMTYQEIAAILDVPENTVKTIIHRGRATLARALERTERES